MQFQYANVGHCRSWHIRDVKNRLRRTPRIIWILLCFEFSMTPTSSCGTGNEIHTPNAKEEAGI
ncbi:UNVERIFIED_CONTAM: hypothetical protein NCL1_56656 [Trichonephila clavipes]